MWSKLCNFICDKLFIKPAVGQKRRNEEWTDDPPVKQMKIDDRNRLNAEESYEITSNMKKENSISISEEGCSVGGVISKKCSSSMARQSIRPSKYNSDSAVTLEKRKLESHRSNDILKQSPYESSDMGEVEDLNFITKSPAQNRRKSLRSKSSYNRIISSYQTSNTGQNRNKPRTTTFQNSLKKSKKFLKEVITNESYRFAEKVQYMQLLQHQATKLNSLLAPFTIPQIGFQKEIKPSIPVIDLTKEKTKVLVNRSKENIPRTSSQLKSCDDLAILNSNPESKEVLQINTLQDILKTHPVTGEDLIDEILSQHSLETAEILRQADIEKAKLEVLSVNNKRSFCDALEDKIRRYMRITAPALEEIEPEEEKYVLPELTREQESKISSLLVSSPAGEILVEKFGLQIKRRDLLTLKGLNWLNDEVINFYMNLIMERGKQNNMPNVYAFNTFFYPKLLSGGHASLKRWTKKVDIFSHDMILVPIHLGMHWCMSVIDFRSKEVRYYDSMGSPNNRCLQALLLYLEAESLDKKKIPYSTSDWEQINVEDLPQQMNGSDCGVFSCMFAEHLARDSPLLFSQENMPYFRKKMMIEIMESKLLT